MRHSFASLRRTGGEWTADAFAVDSDPQNLYTVQWNCRSSKRVVLGRYLLPHFVRPSVSLVASDAASYRPK